MVNLRRSEICKALRVKTMGAISFIITIPNALRSRTSLFSKLRNLFLTGQGTKPRFKRSLLNNLRKETRSDQDHMMVFQVKTKINSSRTSFHMLISKNKTVKWTSSLIQISTICWTSSRSHLIADSSNHQTFKNLFANFFLSTLY